MVQCYLRVWQIGRSYSNSTALTSLTKKCLRLISWVETYAAILILFAFSSASPTVNLTWTVSRVGRRIAGVQGNLLKLILGAASTIDCQCIASHLVAQCFSSV